MTLPRRTNFGPIQIITAGPSPTFTTTPTFVNATGQPHQLSLDRLHYGSPASHISHLCINTPQPDTHDHSVPSRPQWRLQTYIRYLKDIGRVEPESADIYYYIGEAYRFQGFHNDALEAYNHALEIDPSFGPGYLGLARARLNQDPNSNVEYLLDQAVDRDPDFGEIYLERANYYLYNKEYGAALADLQSAEKRLPDSPLVNLTYAKVYLARKENAEALERARKANELDLTILEGYLVLGQAAAGKGEYQEAIKALETYIIYEPRDGISLAPWVNPISAEKYEQSDRLPGPGHPIAGLRSAAPSFVSLSRPGPS
jgi:tetratricopeptide (TPR) repeat protein